MDEAGMGDTDRVSRLVKMTAEHESKLLLVGDAAQLGAIGPGGLFKQLEGRAPTAELTEVHRAHHEWERRAWEQIRNGQPGPALAQYKAHERLHIHDTRAQAAEAMVENWDRTRGDLPGDQAVMITDASNRERDEINAMAQERRAQAGELGSHRVDLPAYAEIGSAAEALDEAAFASDREAHPEWFGPPAENLKEIYALLDTIGWSKTTPPTAVQIDLREDCWAFMRVLTGALEFADEDASEETAREEVAHTSRHLTLVRSGKAEQRAGELWDCIAEAGARIDELAVEHDTGFVLDIAA